MCANIFRFNHTPVKTPINIHKEAPLMVVILIVRHCEEKSFCGRFGGNPYVWWFWPKECNINPFNGDPAICGPFDQNSVAVLANVWPTGQFDQKAVTICGHSRCGRFGVEPFWLGPQV